jgi:hypothetical protein
MIGRAFLFPSARYYYYHALGPILLENRITSSSLYLYHLTGQQLTDCTALHLAAIACLSGEPASQPHAQKLQPFFGAKLLALIDEASNACTRLLRLLG